VALIHEQVNAAAQLDDALQIGARELELSTVRPQAPGSPVDGAGVDECARVVTADLLRGPRIEPGVVPDGAVLPGALGALAVAEVGRLQVDAPEVVARKHGVDEFVDVLPGLLLSAAHGVRVRIAGAVDAPDRRVLADDAIIPPRVHPKGEDHLDAYGVRGGEDALHLPVALGVSESADDVRRVVHRGVQAEDIHVAVARGRRRLEGTADALDRRVIQPR